MSDRSLTMIGGVTPLEDLIEPESRIEIIQRILAEYPSKELRAGTEIYRVRVSPDDPESYSEYDSPPIKYSGKGRLDSQNLSVLYGSQDLQVCLHECRVNADDDIYFATLTPHETLKILDLTAVLEEDTTEFESLDMAVYMLFLAGSHAHEICRSIALEAHKMGFDGIAFPSYFSMLRTGAVPFETSLGISHRRFPEARQYEHSKVVENVGIFGHPVESEKLAVVGINRVLLQRVQYDLTYGPVGVN